LLSAAGAAAGDGGRQAGGRAVKRVNWRTLAAFLALAGLWWFFVLASRCNGERPRPTELVPAGQQDGQHRRVLLLPLTGAAWCGRIARVSRLLSGSVRPRRDDTSHLLEHCRERQECRLTSSRG
jgi:hypothetical protein